MRTLPKDIGKIHFIGIGGIGMSGIAEILHSLDYNVQGSDISDGANVDRLREKGIEVFIGQKASNIENAAVVVYSSAIKSDNPEIIAAREAKIPLVRRAEMLAELMRLKWSVAIAGTHGKTTTTSLVGCVLEEGGLDPTVINGGIVNAYGTNTRMGESDWMVVEADESDGTFTRLPSTIGVITNMDMEHADFYGNFDDIRNAFKVFVENLPFYGFGVLCLDHPEVQSLIPRVSEKRIITYGFNPQADVRAVNVRLELDKSVFDVVITDHRSDGHDITIHDITLNMVGQHNVQNALVAIAIGHDIGINQTQIKDGLANFTGVKRRFTKTGVVNGIPVIDDYGHHPVEIEAVLKAARQTLVEPDSNIIAVFQPHRYSRLQSLFEDFCKCFNGANYVAVADVYPAGENPIEGYDKDALADGLRNHGHQNVSTVDCVERLAEHIASIAKPGDIVVCLGAGDITKWSYDLPHHLEHVFEHAEKKRA